MVAPKTAALLSGGVGLALAGLAACPAISRIYSRLSKRQNNGSDDEEDESERLYEDKDGVATVETEKAFSDKIQKSVILVFSIAGFLMSLILAVLATFRHDLSLYPDQWLVLVIWILLLLQAASLFLEPEPTKRYTLGIYGAASSLFAVTIICLENTFLRAQISDTKGHLVHITLSVTQVATGLIVGCTYILLPRRPDVLRNGKIVDAQYTVSLLGRYAFSWPGGLLKYARSNRTLGIDDLAELDHSTRAETLQRDFHLLKPRGKLWQSLFFAYRPSFILQWTLTSVVAATQFAPQFALLKILRSLEARTRGDFDGFEAWGGVIGLGIAMIGSSWIEAWMFWICFSKIGTPMLEQLSIVIFMKSMKRKDVKGSQKAKPQVDQLNGATLTNEGSGPKGEDTVADGEDEDEIQKTKQSTINLVGVDSKRVAEFATFNYVFLYTFLKLILAIAFLASLIGWIALLSGLAVSAIITPLNVYSSQKYSTYQDKLMKTRDQKMAIVTEALQGIRQIKFSALEQQWHRKIRAIRESELKTQWTVFVFQSVLITIWILGPVMLSAVSLAVYSVITGELSASVAFTTISVFSAIEMTLAIIPEMITELLDARVSIERIEKYLKAPEKVENTIPGGSIAYDKASIAWPADEDDEDGRYILRDLSFSFPNKELSIVAGKTGCGKSLLLSSIIGECDVLGGTIKVPKAPRLADRHDDKANRGNWIMDSAIAYVAQIPWIENASIKDNIIFGLPHDSQRYKKVLEACALEKDLDMLPDGELTDIGANGINLSGGQRWRVTFARALYSRAGILILDDIFSAVDAHVGRHLYEEALTGELGRGRTRILVTHHVQLCLPRTKYMVVLGDGVVEHEGFVDELQKSGSLTSIIQQEQKRADKELENEEALDIDDGGTLAQMLSAVSRSSRRRSTINRRDEGGAEQDSKVQPRKFTEDEKRETGVIKLAIYREYFRELGPLWFWSLIIFFYVAYIASQLARSWWVSVWTRSYHSESLQTLHASHHTMFQQSMASLRVQVQENQDLWYYLGIYVGLSLLICVVGPMRYLLMFVGSIRASRSLFERLTFAVLRAPLRWLDTMPVGRILNRFTSDFNMIDSKLSDDFGFMLYEILQVAGIVVAGLFVSPWMIVFSVILLVICMHYALYYLTGAREVKRLESNAKSPIFEAFGAALTGVGTIRAFDKAETFIERMYKRVDTHCRAYWHLWLFSRWMSYRLNIVGAIFATIIAALIVSIPDMDAPLAGFALSFALQYTMALVWALRQYSSVELNMNATERVVEYSSIEIEDQSGADVPAAWPTEGRLEVSDLVTGYAPDLPPVLKGLSFTIEKNQRVGVVGRTGAGKSSLTLALFRFLEAREGTIVIDGIDISKIKLHDLRSRLAIIPQDPVLFSGTVRSNLDTFDEHADHDLQDALERVHLIRTSVSGTATPGTPNHASSSHSSSTAHNPSTPSITLTTKTTEGGLNLSQGQRQLLCLARAIVSRPKIMVLDEATSAVDMETDALIQRSIREEFTDSTLIVIAHRLTTIADFDKILVMKEGAAVEFGTPAELLEKGAEGEFARMVGESGEKEELERVILGGP